MSSARAELAEAFRRYAIRQGEFVLSSGRTSRWYLDGRQVTFRGDCVDLVGRAVLEALAAPAGLARDTGPGAFDAVGGLELGAVPVALAVARAAGTRSFAVRKEAKGHGVGGRIAGILEARDRVLVVEDTATSGASLLRALDAIDEVGATVTAATVLLDRGGELGPRLEARGVAYFPVLQAPDVGYELGS